jgi:hypothetical protein
MLNIDLIIIELTNCQPFCEVFKQVGIAHVISFKTEEVARIDQV